MPWLELLEQDFLKKYLNLWSSCRGSAETNLTSILEDADLILGLAMSCGIGCRHDSDPKLLWLWYRPAAIALIRLLAWELPYAVGTALKRHTHTHKLFKFAVYTDVESKV